FDDAKLAAIWKALQPLRRGTSPFSGGPTGAGHHWVEPQLVCEVRFTEWTDDGGVRHPIFLGLRPDTRAGDCRKEAPLALAPAGEDGVAAGSLDEAVKAREVREVKLTNLQKVYWPATGGGPSYTKGDLVAYYDRVAPLLLPYLADRPLVLTRYPDGIAGKSFFQKDAPDFAPSWLRTARIHSTDTARDIDYLVVDDALMLRYVANMGTIPLHLWGSRVAALDRPDWLVLDLDPKGAPFTDVVDVALVLRGILEALELPSYPKTSGATGLHILLPLAARYSYEETRTFARLLALLAVEAAPGIATVARSIGARGGKVYVDFGQNGHGQTVVGPYSLRPLPGAPASCPLAWSEVTPRLDPA
ncbi:MAG TPA: non-homologous end-joining DNA ligase, partial [Planctomycetota bacterium]|nr:non-homologous end-joining DNA ligase [Planctomycetota bacterium]